MCAEGCLELPFTIPTSGHSCAMKKPHLVLFIEAASGVLSAELSAGVGTGQGSAAQVVPSQAIISEAQP